MPLAPPVTSATLPATRPAIARPPPRLTARRRPASLSSPDGRGVSGEGVMEVRIRACGPGDAARLALVAQASFLETYVDVLPVADVLAHCRGEHGEAAYAGWLEKPAHR